MQMDWLNPAHFFLTKIIIAPNYCHSMKNCLSIDLRKLFMERIRQGKDYSKGGRPPYDYVLMFKILVLQHFYNISDDQTEFCINDRFSFMQFLNLQLGQRVPDAKTIWHFKNELSREDMINKLFTLKYRSDNNN